MEIVSLKTFKAVVDEGGIKGASVALNTVPSNISTRIQKLEEELGVKLFKLDGRRLIQTSTGQTLYQYACQILQLEYQATTAVQQGKNTYELRIGTPETFAAVHLPKALKKLRDDHRNIHPRLYTAASAELTTAVINNKVDCAFVGGTVSHPDLLSIPIIDETLVVVEPSNKQYDPVLFVREEGCAYRECAISWQQASGKGDEEVMSMSSADGVLGCIAGGLGYTVIGNDVVKGSRYENLLTTENTQIGQQAIHISLIYRVDTPLAKAIHTLSATFN